MNTWWYDPPRTYHQEWRGTVTAPVATRPERLGNTLELAGSASRCIWAFRRSIGIVSGVTLAGILLAVPCGAGVTAVNVIGGVAGLDCDFVRNSNLETTMAQSEKPIAIRQALVVTERERMSLPSQNLRANVTEGLLGGQQVEVELIAGADREDDRVRDRLLLIIPADAVNGLGGYFVLTVNAKYAGSATIRSVRALRGHGRVLVQLEVRSASEMDGWWAYSRRPELRRVTMASLGDPRDTYEMATLHSVDFRQAQIDPSVLGTRDGWSRLEFELRSSQIEESVSLDQCEQLLEAIDARFGGAFLEFPKEALTERVLDDVARARERQLLAGSRQFNVTLKAGGHEQIRGKRLQPFARYPITLVDPDGHREAATLGCSISGR